MPFSCVITQNLTYIAEILPLHALEIARNVCEVLRARVHLGHSEHSTDNSAQIHLAANLHVWQLIAFHLLKYMIVYRHMRSLVHAQQPHSVKVSWLEHRT